MNPIVELEERVSNFFGSPYAVAVDCCTHGIELALRLLDEGDRGVKYQVTCPKWTYLSVPMTFEKLNYDWNFTDEKWSEYYTIGKTNVYDAATLWKLESAWADQKIQLFGYHYHMTFETAQLGLDKIDDAIARVPKTWTYKDYPDLSTYDIFKKGVQH